MKNFLQWILTSSHNNNNNDNNNYNNNNNSNNNNDNNKTIKMTHPLLFVNSLNVPKNLKHINFIFTYYKHFTYFHFTLFDTFREPIQAHGKKN